MGIPMGMGMGWVWGLRWIPVSLWRFHGDFRQHQQPPHSGLSASQPNQMESDGPTSHLGYLNFLALDIKLLRKQVVLTASLQFQLRWRKICAMQLVTNYGRIVAAHLLRLPPISRVLRCNRSSRRTSAHWLRLFQPTSLLSRRASNGSLKGLAVFDHDARNYLSRLCNSFPHVIQLIHHPHSLDLRNRLFPGRTGDMISLIRSSTSRLSGDCSESDVNIAHEQRQQIDVDLENWGHSHSNYNTAQILENFNFLSYSATKCQISAGHQNFICMLLSNDSSAVQGSYCRNSAAAWNQINWRLCCTSNSQSNIMVSISVWRSKWRER